jgi:tetratricopeptide (TPR) repeat protein
LEQAAAAYQDCINRDAQFNNQRTLAVNKAQLGVVQGRQGKHAAALKSIEEARTIFESLSDWQSVARAWGQIGDVYKDAQKFALAERAYRESLAISVQEKISAAESEALSDLGSLYSKTGRLQEAATCYRQAAEVSSLLGNKRREARILDKLSEILLKLGEVDEARRVLQRSLESKEPYGWVAVPWETWDLLYQLEQMSGNAEAAKQSRDQAVRSFLAYRRAGGQKETMGLKLCIWTAKAIENNQVDQLIKVYAESRESSDILQPHRPLFFKLEAVLLGDKNLALADDPDLYYEDAVELRLFLEALGSE